MDSAPLTISDLADVLKGHLNGMGTLEVTGEISGYKTYPSGHHYFALKDSEAKVDCVLYSYQARWLKTPLRDGMKVVAKAINKSEKIITSLQMTIQLGMQILNNLHGQIKFKDYQLHKNQHHFQL